VVMLMAVMSSAYPVWAGTPPTTVVGTDNYEFAGTGNADYVAWTSITQRDPNLWRIKVTPTGGSTFTLNDHGRWHTGGMDRTGSLLSYYRLVRQRSGRFTSDIHLYDMQTRAQVDVPPGVNSPDSEFFPAVSEGRMVYVSRAGGLEHLWLVTDLATGDKIPLLQLDVDEAVIANAPSLIGNWVTYAVCRRNGCNAYRYDIDLDGVRKVPNPLDKYYFAPSADLAGNVYFERSGAACGSNAALMKWTGDGNPTPFYSFASGHDMNGTSVFDGGGGNVTLYADVFGCRRFNQDIISFTNP
jgi:hypothetical protein